MGQAQFGGEGGRLGRTGSWARLRAEASEAAGPWPRWRVDAVNVMTHELLLLVEAEAEADAMDLLRRRRLNVQGRRGMTEWGGTERIWTVGSSRTMAAHLQRLRSVVS